MDDVLNKLQIVSDDVVSDIRQILRTARSYTYKQVNSAMIMAYWFVGKRIVIEEQKGAVRADYGKQLIKKLSLKLADEFGKGISIAQLWNIRQFYSVFPEERKLYTLCRELNWSQLRLIMRLNTEQEREYYIEECRNGSWSVRELERAIKTDMFHRVVANQIVGSNSDKEVFNAMKDPYILEFLHLQDKQDVTEKDIEKGIISHLQQFLLPNIVQFCLQRKSCLAK